MEKQIKEVLTGNSKGSSKKRKSYSFTLCYKNIIIGKLFITSGKWYFQYNSEFKKCLTLA